MPQHLHGDSGVDVEVGQERGAGAPGVVDGDRLDACLVASRLPGALEVAGLDRCAVAGGEDEVGFVPCLAGGCSRLVALLASQFQGGEADVGQGEGGVGRLGLGRQAKVVLGRSTDSESRYIGRWDREPTGRGPHQRQEGRPASPASSPAIR